MISRQRLFELLTYDETEGTFTWNVTRSPRAIAGMVAGTFENGYTRIIVEGRSYLAHRLAWFYHFGVWPNAELDHIDGDRNNNVISNLRDVQRTVNMQNKRKAHANNKTGFLGVGLHKGKYRARIRISGKLREIGYFPTPEAAHDAYLKAKRESHEGCTI